MFKLRIESRNCTVTRTQLDSALQLQPLNGRARNAKGPEVKPPRVVFKFKQCMTPKPNDHHALASRACTCPSLTLRIHEKSASLLQSALLHHPGSNVIQYSDSLQGRIVILPSKYVPSIRHHLHRTTSPSQPDFLRETGSIHARSVGPTEPTGQGIWRREKRLTQ